MLVLTGLVLGVGNWDLPDSTQHWVGATFLAWAGTNQFPLARLTINIGTTLLKNRRNSPNECGGYFRAPWASGKIVTVVLGVVPGGRIGESAPAGRRLAISVGAEVAHLS